MLYTIVAVLVLVLDQAVKFWTVKNIAPMATGGETVSLIPGVIHMTNVQNPGAAFSILADQKWLLIAVSALFIIAIIVLISMDIIHTKFGRWTAVLVMAGALGNCIDRVLYGYVVDMFEIELFSFAVFNIADIFITVCGILFCIHVIVYREPLEEQNAVPKKEKKRKSRKVEEPEEPLAIEEEPQPARRAAARARGGKGKREREDKPDPYANIPHRGVHRSLADELRPQNPDDPFAEWSFGGDAPAPAAPKAPAKAEQPAPAAPKKRPADEDMWDDFDQSVDKLPVRPSAAPAPAADRPAPAAPKAPAKPASEQDVGFGDFSLEDILAEFRDD